MQLFNYSLLIIFSFLRSSPLPPPVVKVDELVKHYTNTSDTTYIVNFWATWCEPCVKELPDFEKIHETYKNKKVKVILVSIDFVADYDSKLVRFVKKNKIQSEVLLLDETKANVFIDKIDARWSGSIPATMIVNNSLKYKEFFENSVSYDFLAGKIYELER